MRNNTQSFQPNTVVPAIIFFVIVLLSVAQLVISNRLTSNGAELVKMESETALLREKNLLLQEEIVTKTSLTQIASRAAELGLVKNVSSLPISSILPIALHQ